MTDEELARLRAHDSNIGRYRRLLKTNLSDLDADFWNGAWVRNGRPSSAWLILLPSHGPAQAASLMGYALIFVRDTRTENHSRGNAQATAFAGSSSTAATSNARIPS